MDLEKASKILDKWAQRKERRRLRNADVEYLPPDSTFKADESYFLKVEGNLKFEDAHGPIALENVVRKEFLIRVLDIWVFFDEGSKRLTKIHKTSGATIAIASSPESRLHDQRHLELWGTIEQVMLVEKLIIDLITKGYLWSPIPTILMQAPVCRHETYIPLYLLCKLLAFHTPNELQRRCGAWIKVDPYESPPAGYEMMQRLVIFGTCEQIYKTMVIINEAVVEPYLDPLSPHISFQNGFTGVSTRVESVAPKKEGDRKRVATSSNGERVSGKRVATSSSEQAAYKTKVLRNVNIDKLQACYRFQETGRRVTAHSLKYPDAPLICLEMDDPPGPFLESAPGLQSSYEGCNFYEAEQGAKQLRAQLASTFYANLGIEEDDIFVSGGTHSDISRLQVLFGSDVRVAVQDPSYLADDVIGQKFADIECMKCTPENDFFPDLSKVSRTDIIFFCSPNNPTGCAASREKLIELVKFAKDNGSIIVYDSEDAMYVSGDTPKSIFEIPGAKEVAIETASCSKYAGVCFGWTVVPKELKFSDGFPVAKDFNRVVFTGGFHGARNIALARGLSCLSSDGLKSMHEVVLSYKENAKIIVDTFTSLGFKVYGGIHAPYVWVHFPGRRSWDVFSEILEKTHVVTTHGSGFGPAGEGFVRFSACGHRNNVLEACRRLKELLVCK